jgi:hypothetical protein
MEHHNDAAAPVNNAATGVGAFNASCESVSAGITGISAAHSRIMHQLSVCGQLKFFALKSATYKKRLCNNTA